MLTELVFSAIVGVDGAVFSSLTRCPACGGKIKAHDMKKKRFASVLIGGERQNIEVRVKRFRCTECGKLCYAESPFYPDVRFGSPVVDLCVANLNRYPYHHLSRILAMMNIVVDRGTIRNYAVKGFDPVPSIEMYGMNIPTSLLSLSELALRRNERSSIVRTEPGVSGRFPSADRTFLHLLGTLQKRDQRNKEKYKEERQSRRQ
jgi:hypothetical protein